MGCPREAILFCGHSQAQWIHWVFCSTSMFGCDSSVQGIATCSWHVPYDSYMQPCHRAWRIQIHWDEREFQRPACWPPVHKSRFFRTNFKPRESRHCDKSFIHIPSHFQKHTSRIIPLIIPRMFTISLAQSCSNSSPSKTNYSHNGEILLSWIRSQSNHFTPLYS